MNDWFVNIVDSEERPDLDAVYLLATHHERPGVGPTTYSHARFEAVLRRRLLPPEDDDAGRPASSVLTAIHDEWSRNPERIIQRADGVVEVLRQVQASASMNAQATLDPKAWLAQTRASVLKRFDTEYGGLGRARNSTKFPQSPTLQFMLIDYQRDRDPDTLRFLTVTLDAMAYGGVYDQLGGGFHRYSTERTWSTPHFEKMLYDNAQLLGIYAQAWKTIGRAQYKRIALGARDYLRRQMSLLTGLLHGGGRGGGWRRRRKLSGRERRSRPCSGVRRSVFSKRMRSRRCRIRPTRCTRKPLAAC
jgi:uncharacterized protein YyaL (SSP411 family)